MARLSWIVRSFQQKGISNLISSPSIATFGTSTCHKTIALKNSDGKFPVTMIPGKCNLNSQYLNLGPIFKKQITVKTLTETFIQQEH